MSMTLLPSVGVLGCWDGHTRVNTRRAAVVLSRLAFCAAANHLHHLTSHTPPHTAQQAFKDGPSSSNGSKQSIEEINRLIGLHMKTAASHIGAMHVRQANAQIGKFVKKAAEEAAAGKLKPKGSSKPSASAKK